MVFRYENKEIRSPATADLCRNCALRIQRCVCHTAHAARSHTRIRTHSWVSPLRQLTLTLQRLQN